MFDICAFDKDFPTSTLELLRGENQVSIYSFTRNFELSRRYETVTGRRQNGFGKTCEHGSKLATNNFEELSLKDVKVLTVVFVITYHKNWDSLKCPLAPITHL